MNETKKRYNSQLKSSKTTITFCIVFVTVFFAAFAVRLIDWQVIHGEEYKKLATRSTSYSVQTPATRGEILDKNGKGLIVNTTHYKITLDKLYLNEAEQNNTILKLIELLESTGDKWQDVLPIEYKNGSYRFADNKQDDSADMLLSEYSTADECISALKDKYKIENNYPPKQLRQLISVYYNMEICEYSNSNPYDFALDISPKAVSTISEHTQDIGGVDIQTYLVRNAEGADLAPHILGALGSVTEEEYAELSKNDERYTSNDRVGKFGVELAFESELKGSGGTKIVRRNSDGAVIDTVETIDAKPGNTIFLTIDKKLQQTAAKSLAENVKAAKEQGVSDSLAYGYGGFGEDCETGAVVMLDVRDFSVLAAASYPTYDLNKYSEYGDYYIKLAEDEHSPMYNRAFVGSFACGSVFKPCVAAAALEEGILTTKTHITCTGHYDYYPTNVVDCMHNHGSLDVFGAVTQSCNYFFAETGRLLGIDTMYLYAERFGLGEYTGVEIEESKGTLAGRDSTRWMAGNTVQAAIGQSDNAFTPLQLAAYTATIANDGKRLKTHLVSKITDYQQSKTVSDFSKPTEVEICGVSEKNLKLVQKSMLDVTQNTSGTAYNMFGDYKVKVAAKTGTAENSGSDHTTFICYAPYEKPEVAIAVVIENGAKGRYSMQVAKDLLNSYFK